MNEFRVRTMLENVLLVILGIWTRAIVCMTSKTEVLRPSPAVEDERFDFEYLNLPGSTHDFRFEVGAGQQECFYQYMKHGADMNVQFEVLRGGDRVIDFVIYDPDGRVFWKSLWSSRGKQDLKVPLPGVYALCSDNSFSRFTSKLIYLYFSSFVISEWIEFKQDFEAFDLKASNVTESFKAIQTRIINMRRMQVSNRKHAISDLYLISANQKYVQNLSIMNCVVILITGIVQLYFVKKLFNPRDVKPSATGQVQDSSFRGIKASA